MRSVWCYTLPPEARACVRVKSHTEEALWRVLQSVHLNASNATVITATLVTCLTREREREKTAAKDMASLAGRMLLYTLEMKSAEGLY
jgi:hypothetical protein